MRVTIHYRCGNCRTTFPVYCGVPDQIDNGQAGHDCGGTSRFAGSDGTSLSYMCVKCGHLTRTEVVGMIPATASRKHGCGEECYPV